jgi:hypothetical protein
MPAGQADRENVTDSAIMDAFRMSVPTMRGSSDVLV